MTRCSLLSTTNVFLWLCWLSIFLFSSLTPVTLSNFSLSLLHLSCVLFVTTHTFSLSLSLLRVFTCKVSNRGYLETRQRVTGSYMSSAAINDLREKCWFSHSSSRLTSIADKLMVDDSESSFFIRALFLFSLKALRLRELREMFAVAFSSLFRFLLGIFRLGW